MSLSGIYTRLIELGYEPKLNGKLEDEHTSIMLEGYLISNRLVDKGFRITGNGTFISVTKGKDVIKFIKDVLEEKEPRAYTVTEQDEKDLNTVIKELSRDIRELDEFMSKLETKRRDMKETKRRLELVTDNILGTYEG